MMNFIFAEFKISVSATSVKWLIVLNLMFQIEIQFVKFIKLEFV